LDGDEGILRYGSGAAGCAGIPFIDVNSEPRIGNAFFATICRNAPPSGLGLLAIGFGQAAVPYNGITILVDLTLGPPILVAINADSLGWAALPVPIPNDPFLIGAQAYLQFAWADGCAPRGIAATQGLRMTLQP
jgi:hypothetical protein